MSINISKGKIYFRNGHEGKKEPSELTYAIIKQLIRCIYIEGRVQIPDKTIFLN